MPAYNWSPSAVARYRSCPLSWWLTYANPVPAATVAAVEENPRVLGVVAHAGFAAAYTAAAADGDYRAGQHMDRYTDRALEAIGDTWARERLPRHSPERVAVSSEVAAVLETLPRPHPSAVLAVERRMTTTGPAGTVFTVVPDLVLRVGPDAVHVRDWKRRAASSLGTPRDLLDDDQLPPYALAVAQHWPWVRRVSVGLFSIPSGREVVLDELPLEAARERVRGQEVTAYEAEHATRFKPTPDGRNCGGCAGRGRCPVWVGTREDYLPVQ